mgnify:CR=1 FL=1
MSKKSIRFFNDKEVRAVWDDNNNCWWFSATDIVRAINNEPDYTKAGNYWRWLKRKLAQEGIELVSDTHEFKFEAPDDKMRETVADSSHIKKLVEPALTAKIDDREMFMKGIDYSYYYEQND